MRTVTRHWCLILFFALSQPALAYKVERVCEDKTTKAGTKTTCRTVLVKPSTQEPVKAAEEKPAHGKSEEPKKHH